MRILLLVLCAFELRLYAGPLRDCAAVLSLRPLATAALSTDSLLQVLHTLQTELESKVPNQPASVKRLMQLEHDLKNPNSLMTTEFFSIRGAAEISAFFKALDTEHADLFASVSQSSDPRREWWFGDTSSLTNFLAVDEELSQAWSELADASVTYKQMHFTDLAERFVHVFTQKSTHTQRRAAIQAELNYSDFLNAFIDDLRTHMSKNAKQHQANGTYDVLVDFFARTDGEPNLDVVVRIQKQTN